VHFLRGKQEAQHLLLEVANDLVKQGRRVVFTIDEVTGDKDGWISGFHEFLWSSQFLQLPYPSTFDIEKILRFHMLRSHWIPSDQDVRDKLAVLVARNVQQYSADLPNIRMFKGALLRVLSNRTAWSTITNIEQQIENDIRAWLA
jgi:chromosomal replication initiation ATPase DnaA